MTLYQKYLTKEQVIQIPERITVGNKVINTRIIIVENEKKYNLKDLRKIYYKTSNI